MNAFLSCEFVYMNEIIVFAMCVCRGWMGMVHFVFSFVVT